MSIFQSRQLRRYALTLTLTLGPACFAGAALADPPSRVGRVSLIEGTVSFHAADQDQWSAAPVNYPVTSGDSFWTEPAARAELQLGGAIVRLQPSTEFDVVALDDNNFQGQIGQGSVNLFVRALDPDQSYQIITARGTIQITRPGRYHIDGGSSDDANAQPTRLEVIDGAAQFVGNGADLVVNPGEAATIGGQDTLTYQVAPAQPDDFDRWAEQRDQRRRPVEAQRYVSPDVTGYEDLDEYGGWRPTHDYGTVWVPRAMPADWAPYRYGHWGYVAPWGWTWIDDAPWGFAPFHYGRWIHTDDGWGWTPGTIEPHPVYAPALVAFVGGPPERPREGVEVGIGIGITIGAVAAAVGWIPLGPHEVYHPPYQASPAYVRNVNITHVTNVTNITNITVNKTVNNYINAPAATVVAASAVTGSQPIGRAAVRVPPAQLARAPVVAAPPAVAPSLATTGASTAVVKAAGGNPAPTKAVFQPKAAPGPVAAPGRPATAMALSRVQPPPPGPKPVAPVRVSAEAAIAAKPAAPVVTPTPAATPQPHPATAITPAAPVQPSPVVKPGAAPAPVPAPVPAPKPPTPALQTAPSAPQVKPAEPAATSVPPPIAHQPGPPVRKPGEPLVPVPAEPAAPAKPAAVPPPIVPAPHPVEAPHPLVEPKPAVPTPPVAAPRPKAKPEPVVPPSHPLVEPKPAVPTPPVTAPRPETRPEPVAPRVEAPRPPEPAPAPPHVVAPPRPEPVPEARPEPRPEPRPAPPAVEKPRPEPKPAEKTPEEKKKEKEEH